MQDNIQNNSAQDPDNLIDDLPSASVVTFPMTQEALALHFAKQGVPVMPWCVKTLDNGHKAKVPLLKGWYQRGSTDPATIRQWFRNWPEAKAGMLTGHRSGISVLDLDVKDGRQGIENCRAAGVDPDEATPAIQTTLTGGRHLLFRHHEGMSNSADRNTGIDVRADNGFIAIYEPLNLDKAALPQWPAAFIPAALPAVDRYSLDELLSDKPPVDWFQVAEALACIPADIDRDIWFKLGAAIHNASDGAQFDLWAEWSKTSAGQKSKVAGNRELVAQWKSMGAGYNGKRADIGTVFYTAQAHGWMPPWRGVSDDDFDDLPDATITEFAADEIPGTIPDYPADELPDLSHDQVALDLGRDGFDANARYVGELGGWLLWEGTRWQASPGMRPMSIVRAYVRAKAASLPRWAEAHAKLRSLDEEAASDLLRDARRWAKAMRQDPFIAAIERQARSNHCSLSRPELWDAEDMLLGTPGGTVDLRTGELRPADRGDRITKNTSVAPAAVGAAPNAWLRFLAEVFPNDPDMPRFIQRLAGYALTGSTREHRLFLFHGSGRNGKGTLLNTLQEIMGDYAKGVPTSALLETRGTQHASPIARLRGARLVRGAELPVGQTWNESLVKQLTGGDSITANLMRQDSFEFTPKFTLIIDGNTKPRIRTTDVAMKARMTLVPFTASFAGREDRGLPERLRAEAGAILRWMIEGAVAWHRDGLGIPAAVEAASSAYLASEDVLADFIADEITTDLAGKVTVKDLYQRYLTWCDHERSKPMSKNTFSEAMVERGHERRPGAKNWPTFYGITLRDDFTDTTGEA